MLIPSAFMMNDPGLMHEVPALSAFVRVAVRGGPLVSFMHPSTSRAVVLQEQELGVRLGR